MTLRFLAAARLLLAACGHATTVRAGRQRPVSMDLVAAVSTTTEPARTTTTQRASRDYRRPVLISATGDVWACIRRLESGGNYAENTGNGYFGAYQFLQRTWDSIHTGYARADLAPPAVQDDAARRLQARSGWGQWSTARRCGV